MITDNPDESCHNTADKIQEGLLKGIPRNNSVPDHPPHGGLPSAPLPYEQSKMRGGLRRQALPCRMSLQPRLQLRHAGIYLINGGVLPCSWSDNGRPMAASVKNSGGPLLSKHSETAIARRRPDLRTSR